MPNKRTTNEAMSQNQPSVRNRADNPIGLTEAFAPIRLDDNGAPYSTNDDDQSSSMGLTEAFGPVVDPEDDEKDPFVSAPEGAQNGDAFGGSAPSEETDHALSEGGSAATSGQAAGSAAEEVAAGTDEESSAASAHAAGENADGAVSDNAQASSSEEASADEGEAEPELKVNHAAQQFALDKKAAKRREKEIAKANKPGKVHYTKHARRVRTALILVILLLIALLAAACVGVYMLLQEVQHEAVQQAAVQQDVQESANIVGDETKDSSTTVTKVTDVPGLTSVLGKNQEEAISSLGHGAMITNSREVNEEGNDIKTSLTVALTNEPADAKSGTPTVYLGLNQDGNVIQAGYSAATTALGYGSLSFYDAVVNEHIVEKTLQEAGVGVAEGTVKLPDNKMDYSTYASDGTTLVKENCTFSGTASVNGADHEWSSVLLYDYTTANSTGNLADTIRMIYVYVNQ